MNRLELEEPSLACRQESSHQAGLGMGSNQRGQERHASQKLCGRRPAATAADEINLSGLGDLETRLCTAQMLSRVARAGSISAGPQRRP